jgi:hypothetical protein
MGVFSINLPGFVEDAIKRDNELAEGSLPFDGLIPQTYYFAYLGSPALNYEYWIKRTTGSLLGTVPGKYARLAPYREQIMPALGMPEYVDPQWTSLEEAQTVAVGIAEAQKLDPDFRAQMMELEQAITEQQREEDKNRGLRKLVTAAIAVTAFVGMVKGLSGGDDEDPKPVTPDKIISTIPTLLNAGESALPAEVAEAEKAEKATALIALGAGVVGTGVLVWLLL